MKLSEKIRACFGKPCWLNTEYYEWADEAEQLEQRVDGLERGILGLSCIHDKTKEAYEVRIAELEQIIKESQPYVERLEDFYLSRID